MKSITDKQKIRNLKISNEHLDKRCRVLEERNEALKHQLDFLERITINLSNRS